MKAEWKPVLLGSVCRVRRGASPRPAGDPRYFGGDVPWIKIADATAEPGRWLTKTQETVNEAGKERSVYLEPGSLIASNSGTCGRPKFLAVGGCIHDGWLAFDRFDGVDKLFLYYLIAWKTDYLVHVADGSVQKNLNTDLLKNLQVVLPPLPEQRAIARILSSLDDKIELNRRMNATLEALAQTLFRAWFVDLEPVKAKAAGLQPAAMDAQTAALFPFEFEASTYGPIPKGWKVQSLDNIATFLNGLALQKHRPATEEEGLPVIKIAQLRSGSANGDEKAGSSIGPAYIVEDGDVLFSWSGSLEVTVWCGGRGALNQHLFKVSSAQFPKWFYLLWTLKHLSHFREIAADKATTMGHIQRKHLTEAKVLVPDEKLLKRMTAILQPLLERQIKNNLESRTLADIRDSLLPRLISGQIRVPDVAQVLAASSDTYTAS